MMVAALLWAIADASRWARDSSRRHHNRVLPDCAHCAAAGLQDRAGAQQVDLLPAAEPRSPVDALATVVALVVIANILTTTI